MRYDMRLFKKKKKTITPVTLILFDETSEQIVSHNTKYLKNLIINGGGNGNIVRIHKKCKLRNVHINFGYKCFNSMCILDTTEENRGLDLYVSFSSGCNNELYIGKRTSMYDTKIWLGDGVKCFIGDDCLFSCETIIRATDGHTILDKNTGEIINKFKRDINIGNHCWIGVRSIINKNVQLSHDTIVGSGSVVTKSFNESYIAIAGNPAKIIKENVIFDWDNISDYNERSSLPPPYKS
ncbi:MAG: acyltransferase [Alphaproteobacteria bacterium]|nr:acyltransferase [Alphaproteobacteria bacterium]